VQYEINNQAAGAFSVMWARSSFFLFSLKRARFQKIFRESFIFNLTMTLYEKQIILDL